MKLKKTILGLAVVAVAGVNAYLANDVRLAKNDLSLLNLENIADAQECYNQEPLPGGGSIYEVRTGKVLTVTVTKSDGSPVTQEVCWGDDDYECKIELCGKTFKGTGQHN